MTQSFGRAQKRRQVLKARKDFLNELNRIIPWDEFRRCLEQLTQEPKSKVGRKPIDLLLLFKLLIVQQLYNLSDEDLEYQTHDRESFRRFVGLDPSAEVPEATTVCLLAPGLYLDT